MSDKKANLILWPTEITHLKAWREASRQFAVSEILITEYEDTLEEIKGLTFVILDNFEGDEE